MLIERLEHIALAVPDAAAAAAGYAAVLDRVLPAGGPLRLQCENIALVLENAPVGPPDAKARTGVRLAFSTRDLVAAKHRLERRGLSSTYPDGDDDRVDLDPAATHGVCVSLVRPKEETVHVAQVDIAGLDHVVIQTSDPERAVALYGGRLGLDLRLDRTNADIGMRQLFFVCGDLVVEVVYGTRQPKASDTDQIWGLAWRAHDLERAHARMQARGIDVTEVREGRRPGTRVFTVKSNVAGVPTLVIGGQGLRRS